jgi:hypothetical protein
MPFSGGELLISGLFPGLDTFARGIFPGCNLAVSIQIKSLPLITSQVHANYVR